MTERFKVNEAEQFLLRFPDIRAGLNKSRFVAENWPVAVDIVEAPDQIGRLFTCFRISLGRINPHFLHWLRVRNMTVAEAVRRIDRMPSAERRTVLSFATEFRRQPNASLELPCYRLSDGNSLILDGNHHAVALALSGRTSKVVLHCIEGPMDESAIKGIELCR
ncbi:hypothetical protein GCM10007989_02270 [Devosia pacifica]|uniref:Uncharacterized protein n=1 Tax=Devosia pacifica TaxID=1335967 RepID=A0A918RUE0_9HYPH|nr:hypothetical protein GCM10007989_02270 [Devosia pacifica]